MTKFSLCALAIVTSLHAAPRPNILYILCDDLGYGDIGAFHQNERAAKNDRSIPFFTTPQIDRLAKEGMMLTQHYCAAPVCAPSRASFLTGQTQGHAGIRDNQFDKALPDTHTIGSVLQEAGYQTGAIGKWGLQGKLAGGKAEPNWEAYPTKRGFDFYFGYVRHRDGHFHYPKEDGRQVWENGDEISGQLDLCFTTDLFTTRAKSWITEQARTSKEPFFLFLAYDTPHAVLHNPPCAFPEGGGLKGGLQWTGKPGAMITTAHGTKDGWMHPDYEKATWDHDGKPGTPEVAWPEVQKRYANNVRRIDDCVGDLLKLLDDLEIADNTLVVFTSDNGPSKESYLKNKPYDPEFFDGFGPFNGIKRDTLEGGIREPTLVRWPQSIPAGKSSSAPSGQWDWLATFAEVAGVPAPSTSDGVSLVPHLTTKGERRNGTLYIEYFVNGTTPKYQAFAPKNRGKKRGQMQVVFEGGYKGLRYGTKSADDDFEIYDVGKDPAETRNLAKKPGFEKLQTAMKAKALQSRIPNSSAPRPYDQALVPGLPGKPEGSPGITCNWYSGTWPWLPDFRTLEVGKSAILNTISLPAGIGSEACGLSYEGFFEVPEDGEYTFALETPEPASLFVHDCRIISGQKNSAPSPGTGKIHLKAGWHPIRLALMCRNDAATLKVSLKGPDGLAVGLGEENMISSSKP